MDQNVDANTTYRSDIAIIAIIIFIVVFILIFVAWYYAASTSTFLYKVTPLTSIPLVPLTFDLSSTPGQTTTMSYYNSHSCSLYRDQYSCEMSPGHFWNPKVGNVGKCTCITPFWGVNGYREAYSSNYLGIGNPDPNDITINPIQTVTVDRLSFPFQNKLASQQIECTPLCDADPECIGVLWDAPPPPNLGTTIAAGQCTLLKDEVTVHPGKNIAFNPNIDSSLYLKTNISPIFNDRVFIYQTNLTTRYWLLDTNTASNALQLTAFENNVYLLPFFPDSTINPSLTGVYSTIKFSPSEIRTLINNGPDANHYIAQPGQPLNLPNDWRFNAQIYVGYILY